MIAATALEFYSLTWIHPCSGGTLALTIFEKLVDFMDQSGYFSGFSDDCYGPWFLQHKMTDRFRIDSVVDWQIGGFRND